MVHWLNAAKTIRSMPLWGDNYKTYGLDDILSSIKKQRE